MDHSPPHTDSTPIPNSDDDTHGQGDACQELPLVPLVPVVPVVPVVPLVPLVSVPVVPVPVPAVSAAFDAVFPIVVKIVGAQVCVRATLAKR
tara:strand:+ start:125 stop:400 length:276 start_codon:yes stop_codon:yes gene_type:complete